MKRNSACERLFCLICGMSYCRFGCGWNGAAERSDGVWVWPDGLAHYVERHHVMLPQAFVAHMRITQAHLVRLIGDGDLRPFAADDDGVSHGCRHGLIRHGHREFLRIQLDVNHQIVQPEARKAVRPANAAGCGRIRMLPSNCGSTPNMPKIMHCAAATPSNVHCSGVSCR